MTERRRLRETRWKKGKKERQTSHSGETHGWTDPSAKRLLQAKGWTNAGWLFRGFSGIESRVGGCLKLRPGPSFENERVRRFGFSSATAFQQTNRHPPGIHRSVTSQPDAVDSLLRRPLRRDLLTLCHPLEEALYLTANNRTIFHVTAFARLATGTRLPSSFYEEAKGNREIWNVIAILVHWLIPL